MGWSRGERGTDARAKAWWAEVEAEDSLAKVGRIQTCGPGGTGPYPSGVVGFGTELGRVPSVALTVLCS